MRVLFLDARFKPPLFGLTTVDYANTIKEALDLIVNNTYDVVSIGDMLENDNSSIILKLILAVKSDVAIFNFHGNNTNKIETLIKIVSEQRRFNKVDIHTVNKNNFKEDGSFMMFINTARNHYAARELVEGDHVLLEKENLCYEIYPDKCIKYNKRHPDIHKCIICEPTFIPTKINEGYNVIFNPFTDLINFTKVRRI